MPIKTIAVDLSDTSSAPQLSRISTALADRFDATIVGFAIHSMPVAVWADTTGLAMAAARSADTAEIAKAEAIFRQLVPSSRVSDWRGFADHALFAVPLIARAADLIVTSSAKANGSIAWLGELVIAAGRPVLVAAANGDRIGTETIVVAWKDTKESRRAVRDALPFLIVAERVVVVAVNEGSESDTESAAGAEDVARYLRRHGAKAESHVSDALNEEVAERLLSIAHDYETDLLVSGGYGHSRLREWAFGGVTRRMLGEGTVNKLLSN